jgi:DNA gyrase subunit A
MHEANTVWNRPYVKCARVVGDVLGKYHPHGDSATYEALVRMVQDFSLRYPLIDGQGNFGSVDGDAAAAYRYTECRLEKISAEMLADIDKETVDFVPNYDGKELEPTVLPARIPNLLINGSSGIAVGMATNIPPHNLTEIITACLALLDNPELTVDELIEHVPAPDFPTAGIIYGTEGVREGYRTGRGRVVIRARTHLEEIDKGGRQAIIVDELPYQVNKATLLTRIGELVREKKLDGISDLRDESDKSGMRVVIELKRGEVAEIILNNLFKLTQLQDSFGMNMVALVDGQPRVLNLRQFLQFFLQHRREVVVRRTRFELRKARDRGHILEGLAVALSNVDEIIALIKRAATPAEAKSGLMAKIWRSALVEEMLARAAADAARPEGLAPEYGWQSESGSTAAGYKLSDAQAQAILELRLQRLTGLEQEKITGEYREVMVQIVDLLDVLAKPERVTSVVAGELTSIRDQFGDKRRSEIIAQGVDLSLEDLIAPEDMIVTMSHGGYMKAQPVAEYRAQRRGGRGKQATGTKDDDFIDRLFSANTHDFILCFSNRGRVYWLKVYNVPQGGRASRGKPIVNLVPLLEHEKITAILPVREFVQDRFVFMATAKGTVKKTPLSEFSRPRPSGIIAVDLDDGDFLVGAALTDGKHDVMLFSSSGKAVRFEETDVRPMGRNAHGVRGMSLDRGQTVISMLVAEDEEQSVLTATENGYGKRTPIVEHTRHGRGTKGMIAIQQTTRNGRVVAASLVRPGDQVMLISTSGVLIRTKVSSIREMSRSTQGVTLINLDHGEKLAGLERVVETEDDGEEEPT